MELGEGARNKVWPEALCQPQVLEGSPFRLSHGPELQKALALGSGGEGMRWWGRAWGAHFNQDRPGLNKEPLGSQHLARWAP